MHTCPVVPKWTMLIKILRVLQLHLLDSRLVIVLELFLDEEVPP